MPTLVRMRASRGKDCACVRDQHIGLLHADERGEGGGLAVARKHDGFEPGPTDDRRFSSPLSANSTPNPRGRGRLRQRGCADMTEAEHAAAIAADEGTPRRQDPSVWALMAELRSRSSRARKRRLAGLGRMRSCSALEGDRLAYRSGASLCAPAADRAPHGRCARNRGVAEIARHMLARHRSPASLTNFSSALRENGSTPSCAHSVPGSGCT